MKLYTIIDKETGELADAMLDMFAKNGTLGLAVVSNWDELEHMLDVGELGLTHDNYEVAELVPTKLKPHLSERT